MDLPPTRRGYEFGEVPSAMQKAIRRADAKFAGYWALELWEKLAANFPQERDYHARLVKAYGRRSQIFKDQLQEYDQALADVDRWLRLKPQNPSAYRRRGLLLGRGRGNRPG